MKNHSFWVGLALCVCVFSLPGCREGAKKEFVVGISQCYLGDAWRRAMINEAQIEASNYDGLEIVVKDGKNNNALQIEQIRELIRQRVDVLIISPYQSGPITAVAEEAYRAGIPTIITDRKVNTDRYTTFVGANNYAIGQAAGAYASSLLKKRSVILEIWGLRETSPAQERHQGFVDELVGKGEIEYRPIYGQWLYDTAKVELGRLLHPEEIDLVYAHNDMLAIAAREYFLAWDSVRGRAVPILGVDAVPGAGLEAVADGRINVSFMYPTGGAEVVRTAMQIIRGISVPKFIPLKTAPVEKQAAETLLFQAEQLQDYRQRIEAQRARIDNLSGRFLFLRDSLLIITLLMVGFVLLSVYVFYTNKKIRKANRALRETNRKEEEQRRKLVALNSEIKEVTAQKLQFFTNVSHEVRTPLTLILAPLDKLLIALRDSPYRADLEGIHKNAARLLRVINQILDFRKVENRQERLKARETELVAFAWEVKGYFDSMAKVRAIDYAFLADERCCTVWIDPDLMEKVLVNLLSNAFKFAPSSGKVTLRLFLAEEQTVRIVVEDNGPGIRPEQIPYLFNRFYSGNSRTGTGIGLHLVDEYVKMHHGSIRVDSEPQVRTAFTVTLPRGKSWLKEENLSEAPAPPPAYDASALDDGLLREMLSKRYPYTLLIVEDDEEMRALLVKALAENFHVLAAADGERALELLEQAEEVSLILSDVMMPGMNGFELSKSVKNRLETSHIPVILLTALTDDRQRLYGIAGGADAYLQKPFRIDVVKVQVIRLLEERQRFRKHLLEQIQAGGALQEEPAVPPTLDELFLRRFLERIEQVYADPEYNVERLSEMLGFPGAICIGRLKS